eukprot:m.14910 g.14910  ORF g.14910 m.14910 type:complete len:136 (+) comp2985_c0_seq1:2249-2656(+)
MEASVAAESPAMLFELAWWLKERERGCAAVGGWSGGRGCMRPVGGREGCWESGNEARNCLRPILLRVSVQEHADNTHVMADVGRESMLSATVLAPNNPRPRSIGVNGRDVCSARTAARVSPTMRSWMALAWSAGA